MGIRLYLKLTSSLFPISTVDYKKKKFQHVFESRWMLNLAFLPILLSVYLILIFFFFEFRTIFNRLVKPMFNVGFLMELSWGLMNYSGSLVLLLFV